MFLAYARCRRYKDGWVRNRYKNILPSREYLVEVRAIILTRGMARIPTVSDATIFNIETQFRLLVDYFRGATPRDPFSDNRAYRACMHLERLFFSVSRGLHLFRDADVV